ncbi:MAG: hypothetical protein ACREDO_06430 [Methyloceanibacter sp.]
MTEQIDTRSKKVRGMARKSIELIEAMHAIAERVQPITGRGIGYKLFSAGLIPSMETKSMQKVYRLLKEARERGIIPWSWIVDETRELECESSWNDPQQFLRVASRSYRRDLWQDQPCRVEVWSEKGTVRGVLAPVLNAYGVGFRVMHGFSGATTLYDVAQDRDGRRLWVLYCGDFDPSGMWMSKRDLPDRLAKYGGHHVTFVRIALLEDQVNRLPSFPAADKVSDPHQKWFVENYGAQCWELNRDTCRWAVLGEAAEVRRSDTRKAIITVLVSAEKHMTPEEIALATGLRRNAVHQRLGAMLKDGEVTQVKRGKYAHPSADL